MSTSSILVTGASGKLGRLIVDSLLRRFPQRKVIVTSRTPEKLSELAAKGVEVRQADFADEASVVKAFQGVDRVLLISIDSLLPGVRSSNEGNAVRAAQASGVKHIVYSSVSCADPDSDFGLAKEYGKTEKFIKENFKGTHTFLHSNWWLDSFYDLAIASSVKTGTFYSAAGKGRCAFVTRGDYADGAAAVLVSEAYKNEVIDFSGPEALSYPDVFERVKEATGIAVNVVDVPAATKADGIAKATNLPQFVVDALVGFDTGISNGLFDVAPSQGAEYIGHKPDSVIDFLNKGGRVEALKAAAGKA